MLVLVITENFRRQCLIRQGCVIAFEESLRPIFSRQIPINKKSLQFPQK